MAETKKSALSKNLNIKEDFPLPTYQDWLTEAEKLLKGAPFDKVLKTQTPEGITLQPIYTAKDTANLDYIKNPPGFLPYVRGANTYNPSWKIQQVCKTSKDITEGINSVRMYIDGDVDYETIKDVLVKLLKTGEKNLSYDIETTIDPAQVLQHLTLFYNTNKNKNNQHMVGSLCLNIFKKILQNGYNKKEEQKDLLAISKVNIRKNLLVDLSIYNDCGASAVDEVGIMAATMVYFFEEMQRFGYKNMDTISRFAFKFAVGSQLFTEIAKLRAARLIFSKVIQAYDIDYILHDLMIHGVQAMPIAATTSRYTKTFYDPWVNILRTTTEAFAAVVGGCDTLIVSPYDTLAGNPDNFAIRIAKNQQLILREEAHLNYVQDAAGGSYYVEALTNEIAKKAWDFFLEIEKEGGIIKALQSGLIASKIQKSHEFRLNNAETRKDAIIGTSTFPNLSEKRPSKRKPDTQNKLIPKRRIAETFENVRLKVEAIKPRPKVMIANIGNALKNKPRIDFCVGYFEPAGFSVISGEGFETTDQAIKATLKSEAQIIVLCSTDDAYPTLVPDFAKKLRAKDKKKVLVLAGYPKEHIEAFSQAGIEFYVYMRQNVVQNISSILKRMGV